MAEPLVRYEAADGFATLTLDSPHNRNALSARLVAEALEGLGRAEADADVRAVVLTHTGRTFCAGADLGEAADAVADPAAPPSDVRTRGLVRLLRAVVGSSKPVLARLDGHVRAGGMGIVAACDIVVAGPASTFALTEVRLGLAPFMISLTLLPRIGQRAADRYFLTGETFDAGTAADIGLVTVASDDPLGATRSLLGELAKASPRGLAEAKRLTTTAILAGFDRAEDELAARSAQAFDSEEAQEGIRAFFEKRPPRWAR